MKLTAEMTKQRQDLAGNKSMEMAPTEQRGRKAEVKNKNKNQGQKLLGHV